jgi:signal transduction histidine kinase
MIVHDLRQPLTSLIGGLDLLQMTMSNVMGEEQKALLNNARRSGHVLLQLVGEILDIHKMEAGHFVLDVEPVNLCEVIQDNVATVQPLTELEGQHVEVALCSPEMTVRCEEQLISRVISNLLSNAVKYTPKEGRISVTLEKREDAMVQVNVADTGVGIAEDALKTIFDKFSQVQHKDQQRHGTGLGLTFCKMVVEAHGGDIWVESEPGRGSTFSFTLPIQGPPSPEVNLKP